KGLRDNRLNAPVRGALCRHGDVGKVRELDGLEVAEPVARPTAFGLLQQFDNHVARAAVDAEPAALRDVQTLQTLDPLLHADEVAGRLRRKFAGPERGHHGASTYSNSLPKSDDRRNGWPDVAPVFVA